MAGSSGTIYGVIGPILKLAFGEKAGVVRGAQAKRLQGEPAEITETAIHFDFLPLCHCHYLIYKIRNTRIRSLVGVGQKPDVGIELSNSETR